MEHSINPWKRKETNIIKYLCNKFPKVIRKVYASIAIFETRKIILDYRNIVAMVSIQ
jgi:hypothetical protein